jgi:hypothetical protein
LPQISECKNSKKKAINHKNKKNFGGFKKGRIFANSIGV